jgi:hypothetical protein
MALYLNTEIFIPTTVRTSNSTEPTQITEDAGNEPTQITEDAGNGSYCCALTAPLQKVHSHVLMFLVRNRVNFKCEVP